MFVIATVSLQSCLKSGDNTYEFTDYINMTYTGGMGGQLALDNDKPFLPNNASFFDDKNLTPGERIALYVSKIQFNNEDQSISGDVLKMFRSKNYSPTIDNDSELSKEFLKQNSQAIYWGAFNAITTSPYNNKFFNFTVSGSKFKGEENPTIKMLYNSENIENNTLNLYVTLDKLGDSENKKTENFSEYVSFDMQYLFTRFSELEYVQINFVNSQLMDVKTIKLGRRANDKFNWLPVQ